jgi:TM2 domain-containing membrane protein YozV
MSELKVQEKTMMLIICLFAGSLGIHRLMMGYKNWWVQALLSLLCGIGVFWALFDLIQIAAGNMKMVDGRDLV